MPIRRWPSSERPRERMLLRGPETLTEAELLALVVGSSGPGSGGVLATCREMLTRFGGLAGLVRCRPGELMQVAGIGEAKACAVAAALEIGRRLQGAAPRRGHPIRCAEDVFRVASDRLALRSQEGFLVLALDVKHRLLATRQVALGSATSVEVHPREVFGTPLREGAAAIIVAHNHPSGDPEPSEQDRLLTRRLKQVGELLGVPLLDHIVLGAGCYVSLADRGVV